MAVVISATSGTWINGQTVTISGSGMGVGPSLIAYDSFDGGTHGAAITTPEVGAYEESQATYSNVDPHSGLLCALSSPNFGDSFKAIAINLDITSSERLYFSAWLKCVGGVGGQKKIFQLWGRPYTGNYAPGFASSDGFSYIAREDVDYLNQTYYPGGSVDQSGGTWQHWEIVAQQNSAGGDTNGSVVIYVDRRVIFQYFGNVRRDTSRAWGPLYWMDGHTNPSSYVTYYSDMLLAQTGWERVQLGNASTYAACTHMETQRPLSWSASSVQVRIDRGSFASNADVYLYVFDSTGTPNSAGYPVTLGTGGSAIVPVAAFQATPLTGQAPLTVNFTDQSTNTPTSWAWSFGYSASPSTATEQNPNTTYAYGGAKTVTLTATNSAGSDDETKTNYISAKYLKPTNFGAN